MKTFIRNNLCGNSETNNVFLAIQQAKAEIKNEINELTNQSEIKLVSKLHKVFEMLHS
jgi:hypothetical protein